MKYQVIKRTVGMRTFARGGRRPHNGTSVMKEFRTKLGAERYLKSIEHRRDKATGFYIKELNETT